MLSTSPEDTKMNERTGTQREEKILWGILTAAVAAGAAGRCETARAADPPAAITRQQIEADWLGEQAVRGLSLPTVLQRGRQLGQSLRRLGANVEQPLKALEETDQASRRLPAAPSDAARRELYLRARDCLRRMALANPLLDFDDLLFVKRVPGSSAHMCDQYYGWFSRPGGGLYVLRRVQDPAAAASLPERRSCRRAACCGPTSPPTAAGAVCPLQVLSRTWPASRTSSTRATCPKTPSITSTT